MLNTKTKMLSRKLAAGLMALCCALVLLGSPTTAHASSGKYTSVTQSASVDGGGTLYSHTERQTYGSTSGNVRTVKFYVYAKYSGSQTVTSIRCSWQTGAIMKSGATLTMSIAGSTSKTVSVTASASSTSTYTTVTTATKYWCNTNGSKVAYENSNFTLAPKSYVKGYKFWVTSTAKVYTENHARATEISSGC